MQNKFEQILLKENQFLNTLNSKAFNSPNIMSNNNMNNNYPKNVFMENMNYQPKMIPDDEDVRKNISAQINFVN